MMLDKIGYVNVSSTIDSREVEGLYKEHAYNLILLDIRLPHMDGFQVIERLLDGNEDDYLPILIITAQAEVEVKQRVLQCIAKDFITKPFEHVELMNRIANMLEVRTLYNERRNQADILEQKVEERTRQLSAI
jgi:putative two-component system response regulator